MFLVLEQETRVYQRVRDNSFRAVLVSEIHKRSLSFSCLVSDSGFLQGRPLTRACERYMVLSTQVTPRRVGLQGTQSRSLMILVVLVSS